jgi:small redox-active disulfide protein 2
MNKIEILGPGCRRCQLLAENVQAAVVELGLDVRVEKVMDLKTIASMGVLTTPGLAVDGAVRSTGRLLTVRQVKELLEELAG